MPRELLRHPLSKFWDDLGGSQFAELVDDIRTYGLHHPITLYDGQVLDGWQRYRACRELGTEAETKTFRGTPAGAAALVKSLNAHRRLLMTESQRAFAIVEMSKWVEGCQKGGGVAPATPPSAKTNAEMAAESGTSRDTVQRAKRVAERGSEELKAAVRSGEVPVKKAAAATAKPKREQLAAAKAKPEKAPEPEAPDPEEEAESIAEAAGAEFDARIARVLDADDKLRQMAAELKQAAQEIVALKQARDRYMNESSAMRQQLQKKDREIARLKKAAK